jgi:stage II sporulation protein D
MQPLGRMPRHIPLLTILLAGLLVRCQHESPPAATRPASPSTQTAGGAALDRSMRVMLLRDTPECVISIPEPFDVVDAQSGAVLGVMDYAAPLTVSFSEGAIHFVEPGRACDAGVIDLRPRGGGRVAVRDGDKMRRYRGWLRLARHSPDRGSVLNIVDAEEYLLGVVTVEMPADFKPAALYAQAVACRTYAWYQKRFHGLARDWDVLDNEGSQAYGGADAETDAAARAVVATSGIVCTWASPAGERIFPAYFSSTCGGVTRVAPQRKGEPKFPVLGGDVLCDFCASSPAFRWGPVTISKRQITERLRERYPRIAALGPIAGVAITGRTPMGRPVRVEVSDGDNHRVDLDIEDFRLTVDPTGRVLKSGHFTPVVQKDAVVFTQGRGYGHGWGMCQYGANALAKGGKSATEILHFYYPGCHLVRAY